MTRAAIALTVTFVAFLAGALMLTACSTESSKSSESSDELGDEEISAASITVEPEAPPLGVHESEGHASPTEVGHECGNFIDEDFDGVCDLAQSGECRRGRQGRCPVHDTVHGNG